jgi:hypothetical protein
MADEPKSSPSPDKAASGGAGTATAAPQAAEAPTAAVAAAQPPAAAAAAAAAPAPAPGEKPEDEGAPEPEPGRERANGGSGGGGGGEAKSGDKSDRRAEVYTIEYDSLIYSLAWSVSTHIRRLVARCLRAVHACCMCVLHMSKSGAAVARDSGVRQRGWRPSAAASRTRGR